MVGVNFACCAFMLCVVLLLMCWRDTWSIFNGRSYVNSIPGLDPESAAVVATVVSLALFDGELIDLQAVC